VVLKTTRIKNDKFRTIKIRIGCLYIGYPFRTVKS